MFTVTASILMSNLYSTPELCSFYANSKANILMLNATILGVENTTMKPESDETLCLSFIFLFSNFTFL